MERIICLDGVPITLEVDKVEIDLKRPDLKPSFDPGPASERHCCGGQKCQPLMRYQDGTVIYLHCPPEGEEGPLGYRIESPAPHRWNITFLENGHGGAPERIARLSWDMA